MDTFSNIKIINNLRMSSTRISKRTDAPSFDVIKSKLEGILENTTQKDILLFTGEFLKDRFDLDAFSYLLRKLNGYRCYYFAAGNEMVVSTSTSSTISLLSECGIINILSSDVLLYFSEQGIMSTSEPQAVPHVILSDQLKAVSAESEVVSTIQLGTVYRNKLSEEEIQPSYINVSKSLMIDIIKINHQHHVFKTKYYQKNRETVVSANFVNNIDDDFSADSGKSSKEIIYEASSELSADMDTMSIIDALLGTAESSS